MAMQTANFPNLLSVGIRDIVDSAYYDEWPQEYTRYLNEETEESRNFFDDLIITGFDAVPAKAEGAPISYVDAVEGPTKRYTFTEFALGFIVTRPMWRTDQYGKIRQLAEALAVSFRELPEVKGADLLNNAFSGDANAASFLGADGKTLLATDHPLFGPGGGTWSNRPAVNSDLSYTAMQDAILVGHRMVNENNLPVPYTPELVLCSPENMFKADLIFGQDTEPNTANRNINVVQKYLRDVVLLHYVTAHGRWFVRFRSAAPNGGNNARLVWSEKPIFETVDDPDTKNVKTNGYCRFGVGFTMSRSWFGSPGL